MSHKYLLDSSAWIEYFAGTAFGKEIKNIVEGEELVTCVLSIAELSDKFNRDKERFEAFLAFIKKMSFIAPLSVSSCTASGSLKALRRTTKKNFGLVDALIYLTAQEHRCLVLTKDDDFNGMTDVIVLS